MLEKAVGATVRGKFHKNSKLPNQDHFLIDNRKHYTLAVVCDGLGSKKYSQHASKKLCKIIKKEVRYRFKHNNLNPYETIESIQKKYIKKLWPFNLTNADTTCLFVIVSNKSILMCQIGDGLIASKGDKIITPEIKEKDFTNETRSFGKSKKKDWNLKMITKEENQSYKLILCTDGIAEDIIIDSLGDFVEEVSKLKNLKTILKEWPNVYSNDDKTIVVVK